MRLLCCILCFMPALLHPLSHLHPYMQALQLHILCEDAMDDCWPDLVEILSYLPYLGCIHDGPIVVSACDKLTAMAQKRGDSAAQALCKTVASYFMPTGTPALKKEILPLVRGF